MRKLLVLATIGLCLTPVTARAAEVTQVEWSRTGAEHLPCVSDVLWTLSPGHGIDNATVGINDADGVDDGHAWTMLQDWQTESWYITSTEPVNPTDEVLLAYVGTATETPVLALSDCVEAAAPLPVPTTGSVPTPAPEPQGPVLAGWDIGYRVTTIHWTNVLVRSRVSCSNGSETRWVKRSIRTHAPFTNYLKATLDDATECHLRVVAWDIKPHVRPHNWPAPVVETWVNQT